MDIGKMLKALRASEGYTLKEAARHAKISGSHLSEIERGNKTPRFDTVERIAKSYGYIMNISFISGSTMYGYTSKE